MSTLPLNIQHLQFISIISNTKNYLLKLLDTKTTKLIKFKYITPLSPYESQIYLHFLTNLTLINHNNNSLINNYLHKQLFFQLIQKQNPAQHLIFIKQQYKNQISLQRYFISQLKDKHCKLQINKTLLITLFDLVFRYNQINHLVINNQNVFVSEDGDLSANSISFVGVELIIFGRSISREQFKKIYAYLDSNIFGRSAKQRINYRQRYKNLGALILELITDAPLKLLELQQLPEEINLTIAMQLLKKSKEKYKKLLQSNPIRQRISKYSSQLQLNLTSLLNDLLVTEKQMQWSEIKDLILPFAKHKSQQRAYIQQISKQLWWGLPQFQQKRLKMLNIINNQDDLTTNSQLFMIYKLNLEIKSLKNGSIIEELANHREYNMKKHRITAQSLEIMLKQSKQFMINSEGSNDYSQEQLQLQRQQQENQQKAFIFNLYTKAKETSISQTQAYQQEHNPQHHNFHLNNHQQPQIPQINIQSLNHSSSDYEKQSYSDNKDDDQPIILKQDRLQRMMQFYQRQLTIDIKYKERQVKIEHDRVKCLKMYREIME